MGKRTAQRSEPNRKMSERRFVTESNFLTETKDYKKTDKKTATLQAEN